MDSCHRHRPVSLCYVTRFAADADGRLSWELICSLIVDEVTSPQNRNVSSEPLGSLIVDLDICV